VLNLTHAEVVSLQYAVCIPFPPGGPKRVHRLLFTSPTTNVCIQLLPRVTKHAHIVSYRGHAADRPTTHHLCHATSARSPQHVFRQTRWAADTTSINASQRSPNPIPVMLIPCPPCSDTWCCPVELLQLPVRLGDYEVESGLQRERTSRNSAQPPADLVEGIGRALRVAGSHCIWHAAI
jgi:hypothetical protein